MKLWVFLKEEEILKVMMQTYIATVVILSVAVIVAPTDRAMIFAQDTVVFVILFVLGLPAILALMIGIPLAVQALKFRKEASAE